MTHLHIVKWFEQSKTICVNVYLHDLVKNHIFPNVKSSSNSKQLKISRANDTVPINRYWNISLDIKDNFDFSEIRFGKKFHQVDTIISKATFCILLFGSVAVMMRPRYSLTSMMMKKPGIQHINTTQKSTPTFSLFYTYPTTFPSHTAIQLDAQHTHFFKDLNLLLAKYLSL